MTKNTVRNLAVCCGAIWRRTEKPKCRCTTTIHRMYKSSNIVLENLLTVWHLVRTTLFVPIRFRLPIRNLIIAVAASWRNAKKSLNRCTSTFSAENYSSGIFFKSLSYPISIKISSFPDARSGAQTFSADFLDFSKFWTAISWNLWRHLASKKNHHFWKKNWKPRRNRHINGNAMLVQTMHPSGLGAWQKNENIQTPHFSTYSWRSLFDLPKLCTVIVLVKAIKKVPDIFRSNT